MPFVKGALAARRDLAAAAQLLHRLCFDRVELDTPRLPHEPRWSCQCKPCAAVWVASKSGSILRIDLDTPTGRPTQTWTGGHSEARTIYHVHDGAALGGGPVLLVGRDNGALEVSLAAPGETASEPTTEPALDRAGDTPSPGSFHLDSWWKLEGPHAERAVSRGFALGPHDGKPYTLGVTAIEVVPRTDRPGTLDILVATRSLWLYVIEAAGGNLTLRHRLQMPGWIQWILRREQPEDVHITCISRGGDIIELSHNALRAGDAFEPLPLTALSLLPTAAMPFDDGFLLGTTTGLFAVYGGRPVTVPITRSPVLCLDRAAVSTGNREHDDQDHDYIVLGLEDGNLRVVDAELIRALTTGDQRPETHHHNFTVEMGSAVLAVETLQPSAPPAERAYVLAVLRDHSLRLFEVTHQRTVQDRVRGLWQGRFAISAAEDGTARVAAELAAARARDRDCDRNAWKYMLIDVVLPDLCERAPGDHTVQRRVVDLAMEMAAGADRLVLHRLSVGLAALARRDVGHMLELSRCLLAAVPHDDDQRWRTFIDRHLRELNALTRPLPFDERARFVAWTRFVRKYMLLGSTFAAKQTRLAELVEQNFTAEKYLDGLIYQARLSQRCYDLRWTTEVEGEVAALHVIEGGAGPAIVVVVTFDGRLAFVEAATGRAIDVRSGGMLRKACAPFGDVQTEASAVARAGEQLRVVLSCSGPSAPPLGLAVFDVRWSDDTFRELSSEPFEVACADPQARVSSVQPLPDQADGFVVGLQTPSAPVGLLWCDGRTWRLDLAADPASNGADADRGFHPEPRSLAPGKVPTRALAIEIDPSTSRYLVATGSEDGFVRAISFAWGEPAADWKITHLDRVADAVSCVVLGPHAPPLEPDPDASQFSCYVGTATGDVFALSIFARDGADAGPALPPFSHYDALPLWRDTHEGPILGVQLWQTPLFVPDRDPAKPGDAHAPETVLVVVTEKGRLAVYRHSPVLDKKRTSALHTYFFRGMRFDRIAMPDRLLACTLLGGARELVAAGPASQRDGTHPPVSQLYMARLLYLRNSENRVDPDPRAFDPRTPLSQLPRELPPEMWGRLHCLFVASVLDAPFELPADQRYERKLDLWDLIRLEGGALSSYALNERLSFHERWDPADTAARAHQLLHPLDPEDREDAERIKIILKSLCRRYLFVDPNALTGELGPAEGHAQAAAAIQVATGYLTDALAYASSAAARLRIVAIKELLRVPVLRHIASGEHRQAIQNNVERALGSCLRDDNRLVRIEALRAVSVMLRNVGVMADAAADRRRLIEALFPDGLGSLSWLLELIVAGLQLFPSFSRRTALVSGAWYHISALLQVFRIFPDHTLALCDYLVRKGLGIEPLAMCFRSLRGPRATTIRHRIGDLYLISAIEPMHARDEFIEHYDRTKPGHAALVEALALPPRAHAELARPWHQIDDAAMAGRLLELLHRLARMWDVRDRRQIDREMAAFQPTPAAFAGDAPLTALERVVAELSSVAADLTQRKPDEVAALDRLAEIDRQPGPGLTAPQRAIVSGVVTAWRDAYNPPLAAAKGTEIAEYTLGKPLSEGGLASVFELTAPRDKIGKYVIKVLRQWNAPHAGARFLDGARFNKELCENAEDQKYIVEVADIPRHGPEQRHLAYVMARYDDSLEGYLRKDLHKDGPKALRWAVLAAQHIGRALRAAHEREHWHGDVKPSNILVDNRGDDPVFRLGDFALAAPDGGDGPAGIAPRCLIERAVQHGYTRRGEWGDIAALVVVLYQMLIGKAIDRGARSLREQVVALRELAATARVQRKVGALRVIETLIHIFQDSDQPIDIDDFLASLELKRTAPPERKRNGRVPAEPAGDGIDVGILTIRDDEFMAVLDRFPGVGTRTGRRKYRMRRLDLGDGQAYSIAVVSCGEQGNTSALDTARNLLDDLAPQLLLVVGIAGGVPHDELTLGDVVVSNRIIDLSVEAVLKDHTRTYAVSGGALHRVAMNIVADLPAMVQGGELDGWNLDASITVGRPAVDLAKHNFYGPRPWRAQVHDSLHRHFVAAPRPARVAAGAIASSDRLIKDTEIVELWMKLARQIRAIEMESAGVYKAAHGGSVPFLAIRGISDIVGFRRDPGWTAYACHSAAAFTRAFLRARPLELLAAPPVSRTSTTT